MTRSFALIALLTLGLAACAKNMSPDVYSSSTSVGKVVYGTIVSARPITIKDSEQLGANGAGVLAGGALGGAAGSGAGKGSGKTAATVGGAIAGAIAGAVIQDHLSTQNGMEYIVRLDSVKPSSASTASRSRVSVKGQGEVTTDIQRAAQVEATETDMISVIQDNSTVFSRGQRVLVVYRDDRARIEAVQ